MKVYDCPNEVPAPELNWDYDNIQETHAKLEQAEKDHSVKLKAWLVNRGYTGKNTGEIFRMPMGDGYAQYMVADAPRKSCLIHLPYGDAWDHRDASFIPKKEVIRSIEAEKKWQQVLDEARSTKSES